MQQQGKKERKVTASLFLSSYFPFGGDQSSTLSSLGGCEQKVLAMPFQKGNLFGVGTIHSLTGTIMIHIYRDLFLHVVQTRVHSLNNCAKWLSYRVDWLIVVIWSVIGLIDKMFDLGASRLSRKNPMNEQSEEPHLAINTAISIHIRTEKEWWSWYITNTVIWILVCTKKCM